VQFTVPATGTDKLTERVKMIAVKHGMTDCMSSVEVNGATTCFKTGDASFTFLGVRQVGEFGVVDLSFRSAGVGGQLFNELRIELLQDLKVTFGTGGVEERDPKNLIPIERRGS